MRAFCVYDTKKLQNGLTAAMDFAILHKVLYGEMSERFMEPVLKTGDAARHRGFESLSLRQNFGEVPKWL